MTRSLFWFFLLALNSLGCGGSLSDAQAKALRNKLRVAMDATVHTPQQRDAHSRVLADVVGRGVVEGLSEPELRAAFGQGRACRVPLCAEHGFAETDWYFEIGVAPTDATGHVEVKQLPVMIIGFNPSGRAARVWTLTTHE